MGMCANYMCCVCLEASFAVMIVSWLVTSRTILKSCTGGMSMSMCANYMCVVCVWKPLLL